MRRALFLSLCLVSAGGVLLALVPLSRGAEEPARHSPNRQFTISADPTVEVLRLTSSANFERYIYTLYGDGLFRVERRMATGDLVTEGEAQYPFREVDRLVRLLVAHRRQQRPGGCLRGLPRVDVERERRPGVLRRW